MVNWFIRFVVADLNARTMVANEASTWHITLSNLLPETYVFIKAHPDTDNIELTVPSSSGYQFTTTVLADNPQWNNMQPIESGKYQSNNFAETKSRIFIQSNTNAVAVRVR